MTLSKKLESMNACPEAVEWTKGKSLSEAWRGCKRADWMLWLLGRMVGNKGWPTHKQVVLLACDCAELALRHVPDDETRPAEAIRAARRWCRGRATIEKVRRAAYAAYAADAAAEAARAAYAAAFAAADAAYAAYAADAAAYVADAAAYVAYAAAYAAYAAAYAAVYSAAYAAEHVKMCRMIRAKVKPGRL
jgi:hypothetical protein